MRPGLALVVYGLLCISSEAVGKWEASVVDIAIDSTGLGCPPEIAFGWSDTE